jgi:hypothetical protein
MKDYSTWKKGNKRSNSWQAVTANTSDFQLSEAKDFDERLGF